MKIYIASFFLFMVLVVTEVNSDPYWACDWDEIPSTSAVSRAVGEFGETDAYGWEYKEVDPNLQQVIVYAEIYLDFYRIGENSKSGSAHASLSTKRWKGICVYNGTPDPVASPEADVQGNYEIYAGIDNNPLLTDQAYADVKYKGIALVKGGDNPVSDSSAEVDAVYSTDNNIQFGIQVGADIGADVGVDLDVNGGISAAGGLTWQSPTQGPVAHSPGLLDTASASNVLTTSLTFAEGNVSVLEANAYVYGNNEVAWAAASAYVSLDGY